MMRIFFPPIYFPTKTSVLALVVFTVSMVWLIMMLIIMPTIGQILGTVFTQPKILNALLLSSWLFSGIYYAIERYKSKLSKGG